MVESFLESNKKRLEANKVKLTKEEKEACKKAIEDLKKFKDLTELDLWKDCRDFLKDEIYEALSFTPGDGGDWWLKYSWGLKCCLKRIEGHAKKYDEAVELLNK